MSRRIHYRLLIGFVVIVAVLAFSIHFLHGYQARRGARSLLKRAIAAESAGEVAEAQSLLKRYLAFVPQDQDALARYGMLIADGSRDDRARAAEILQDVVDRDPSRRESRRKLALALFEDQKFDEARVHLEILQRESPDDDEVAWRLGRCQELAGAFDQAVRSYEQALRDSPESVETYARLALLLRARFQRNDDADRLMDAVEVKDGLIARNPQSFRAFLERCLYRERFQIAGADDDIDQAMKLAPTELDVLLFAAIRDWRKGNLDQARTLLNRGIQAKPDDPRAYRTLADLESASNQIDAAIATLEAGIEAVDSAAELRWRLAMLLAETNRADQAEKAIGALRDLHYPTEPVDYLEARVLASRGRWSEASRILSRIAPSLAAKAGSEEITKRVFLLMGQAAEQLGNGDQQYQAFRRAVAITFPNDFLAGQAHIGLASALVSQGKLDEAINEYQLALNLPGTPKSIRVTLARLMVLRNLRQLPSQRSWVEVDRMITAIEADEPDSAEVAILRAEALAAQDRRSDARVHLEAFLQRNPSRAEPRAALAELLEQQGKSNEVLALLGNAEKQVGDRPELRLARIRYWLRHGGKEAIAGLEQVEQGIDKERKDSDRRRLWNALALAYQQVGAPDRAARIRDRLIAEQPDNLTLRIAQYDAAVEADDETAMARAVDEIRRIEGPDGIIWRYSRARLLIRRARTGNDTGKPLDEARRLLAEVAQKRPGWAVIPLVEAEIDELRGDPGSALRGYLKAIELGENRPETVRRAVDLLYRAGRYIQADQVLRRLQEQAPLSPELQQLAADVLLRNQDHRRAVDLARKTVPEQSQDPRAWTWLGQTLSAAATQAETEGRSADALSGRDQAERALRRAVDLAPGEPEAWAALVQFQIAAGKPDRALEVIHQARTKLPGDRATLALAQFFEIARQNDRAAEQYAEALKARPEEPEVLQAIAGFELHRGQTQAAEPHLRKLVSLADKSPREAAWARRLLAMILASSGDLKQTQAALNLLSDDNPSAPRDEAAETLRARVRVLAAQPDPEKRREAMAILDRLDAQGAIMADDLLVLAKLRDDSGDWTGARKAMLKVLDQDPRNLAAVYAYAKALLAHRQADEAARWVESLDKLRPGSAAVVELRARLLAARSRGTEAADLVARAIQGSTNLAQLTSAATFLEELKQFPAAETLFRRASTTEPAGLLAWIGFLGRQGRCAEAVDAADQAWAAAASPPEAIANAIVTALYAGQPDSSLLQRVDSRLGQAIAANPQSLSIAFDRGNLWLLAGRSDEAESLFRKIHEDNRNNVGPMNNLAWLLALRGKPDEAMPLIDRAIQAAGPVADLLDTRGLIHLAAGRIKPATQDLETAAEQDPTGAAAFHLAALQLRAKRPTEAAQSLKRAQSAGFSAERVHPLEREVFHEAYQALKTLPSPERTALDGPRRP